MCIRDSCGSVSEYWAGGLRPSAPATPEGHSALLCQIHTLIGGDVLPEFGSQFRLGVGVDVSEDGVAVLLMANDDATLPAVILPPAYHAAAGWSSFCHCGSHI